MELLTFSNISAYIGAAVAVIAIIKMPKGLKNTLLILCAVFICVFTVWDNYDTEGEKNKLKGDINTLIEAAHRDSADNASTLVYLQRIDSIGIKRDTLSNKPIITKRFVNYIDHVGILNQY